MNNSTKKFLISNSFYAASEILSKASESQENQTASNALFGLSIAAKIGMNIFIIKGVFDKLNENNQSQTQAQAQATQELQEIIIESPSPFPSQAISASLVNLQNTRV
jgi:uncharacterized transporter YbjL